MKRGEENTTPKLTIMVMTWGQIIDHDIELTPPRGGGKGAQAEFVNCCEAENNGHHPDCCSINALDDDPFYGRSGRPKCMPVLRSRLGRRSCRVSSSSLDPVNDNTPWIDASFVYGSSDDEAEALRLFSGGLLKTNPDRSGRAWAPFDVEDGEVKWKFGDRRGDVHPAATMLTTVFLRRHNQIAEALSELRPDWDDERLFQETRRIVAGIVQKITFTHFMDALLGTPNSVSMTEKPFGSHRNVYDADVDATITMGFGTAGYRLHTYIAGHFELRDRFFRLHRNLRLRDVFNNPVITMSNDTYDDLMRGLCGQPLHAFDNVFTGEMTEWLFKNSEDNWGMDIAAINIQRGRDHRIAGYPEYRRLCRLGDPKSWNDFVDFIPGDLVHRLVHAYDDIEDVDMYVAGNMEEPVEGAILGPTFHCLVRDQFRRLRDGDRFFYTNRGQFDGAQLAEIEGQTLASVMCEAADNPDAMILPDNVFRLPDPRDNRLKRCSSHRKLNLNPFAL